MLVCLGSQGEGEDGPEIELFHENITMANRFTVKAIKSPEERTPVCST